MSFTFASHVETIPFSYKRPLSSGSGAIIPAKRLSLPTGSNQKAPPFPATTARPDQRVNVRVPVTRACFSRLIPGQVAFVSRHFNKNYIGAATGPGGVAHILSLEELNAKLALPDNLVVSTGTNLFKKKTANSMFKPNNDGKTLVKLDFDAFNIHGTVPDTQHPIHQFALDGLVATRVEDVDDIHVSGSTTSQQLCTVAVKGHAPMRISEIPGDIHFGVRESSSGSTAQSSTTYLRPARVLAKVFVVLVAVRVEDVNKTKRKKWRLQYETVSSSNLDVDPQFSSGHKLFRTKMSESKETGSIGFRLVLRVFELGTIVDTKFGPAEQPQLVVCVHVTPFEATEVTREQKADGKYVIFRKPLNVFSTFVALGNPKAIKARSLEAPHSALRRLSSGVRPAVTGALAEDIEAMKKTISYMKVSLMEVRDTNNKTKKKLDSIISLLTSKRRNLTGDDRDTVLDYISAIVGSDTIPDDVQTDLKKKTLYEFAKELVETYLSKDDTKLEGEANELFAEMEKDRKEKEAKAAQVPDLDA